MQSVDIFRAPTAFASVVGLVVQQNVIPMSLVLSKRTNQSSASLDGLQSATVSPEKNFFLPVERAQKRQRGVFPVGVAQACEESIITTPQNGKSNHRNRIVAPLSNEWGLFDESHRDFLPADFTSKAHVE